METVGQRLKRLRENTGFSQRQLAEPGVSYAYISRIEAGTRQPSTKALRKIAPKLGVSVDYLEFGEERLDTEARLRARAAVRVIERHGLRLEYIQEYESLVRENNGSE